MKLLASTRNRLLSTPSDSNRSASASNMHNQTPPPTLTSTGSRVGEVAQIAAESNKRTIAFPLRLNLLNTPSQEVAKLTRMNCEAEVELARLQARQQMMLESARRAEPQDGTTVGEHAELAWSHLLQGLTLSWTACYAAAADASAVALSCCSSLVPAPRPPDGGGPRASTPMGSRKSASGGRNAAPSTPDRSKQAALIGGGETAVREAHLMRSIKRSYAKYGGTRSAEEEEQRRREARARVLEDKAADECTARWVWCPLHTSRQVRMPRSARL